MEKWNMAKTVKNIRRAVSKHSPEILTGIGIAGMVTTAVMAVRATPKALILIEEEKERQNDELLREACENGKEECARIEKLKPLDLIKTTWVCYIPSAVVGGLAIACLIGASSANLRRNAALATAYALSESALKEYQEKVVKTIGEKKEQAVRDEIAKEKLQKNPVVNQEVIITEKGNTLCFDVISGRYFKSDIEKLRRIENELNRQMRDEMYISLNDFYYEVGLGDTKMGDDLGWNINEGYIDLSFSSQLAEDGTPCLVLDYRIAPKYDYRESI